jgi:hypothetical protein
MAKIANKQFNLWICKRARGETGTTEIAPNIVKIVQQLVMLPFLTVFGAPVHARAKASKSASSSVGTKVALRPDSPDTEVKCADATPDSSPQSGYGYAVGRLAQGGGYRGECAARVPQERGWRIATRSMSARSMDR